VDKQAICVSGHYQLDVDINTVVFWHHHLFSQEHVYASQITRLYEEYVSRTRKKTVEFLTGKVCSTDQQSFRLFLAKLCELIIRLITVLVCMCVHLDVNEGGMDHNCYTQRFVTYYAQTY